MGDAVGMKRRRLDSPVVVPSGFTGFRFRAEVILLAVRWYLRYGRSYRGLEELWGLNSRGRPAGAHLCVALLLGGDPRC